MAAERRTIAVVRDLSAAARDCPLAPPGHASVQARTLHRACLIVGGARALAHQLSVSVAQVERWLTGGEPVPDGVFLRAVDIVLLYASDLGGKG